MISIHSHRSVFMACKNIFMQMCTSFRLKLDFRECTGFNVAMQQSMSLSGGKQAGTDVLLEKFSFAYFQAAGSFKMQPVNHTTEYFIKTAILILDL